MLNGLDPMGHRKEHPDFQDANKYGAEPESHSSAEGKVGLMEFRSAFIVFNGRKDEMFA